MGGIAGPDVGSVGGVLETFHFGAQTLAGTHVMGCAVIVLGIVATAYVVAEYVEIKSLRTYEPIDDFVDFVVAPFSAHIGPPA